SVVTSNNGPIKLEISVNQSSPRNVVEASSQTDLPRKRNDKYIQIVSDSDETEYLPLPFPSGRRNNVRNDEDHHAQYNEYARHPDHDRSRYDHHARSHDDDHKKSHHDDHGRSHEDDHQKSRK
uniref:Uncharacterized protein n=1 Tax=Ciona savignyi TaxID=51511 RepID=H2ZP25_CIOSA